MKLPSLWLPEPNTVIHQAVGKLGEEAAELSKIAHRVLIQGLAGENPTSGEPNLVALLDEMADVEALGRVVKGVLVRTHNFEYFSGAHERFRDRIMSKVGHKTEWLRMVEEHELRGDK